MNHEWPKDPNEHVWSRWMAQTRTTQYRVCIHPECNAHEIREAPRG